MCIDDGNAAKRLERRRDIIRSQMFPNLSTCQLTNPDDLVWVESTPLLQFMSCRDRLRERLEQSDRAVLQHHDLLCSHETPGLHPRVARKGKLLPKLAYEAYIAALRVEKRDILGRDTDENSFNDCLILPTDNLICQDCAQEYRSELSQKLKRVLAMKYIYDSLDPKENKFTLERGLGEAWGNESDRYAYIVSRKFVTWFRNKVVRFMKRAGSAEAKCVECESQFIALSAENEAEGLDGLDLSEFSVSKDEKTGIEPDDVGVAVRVNGPITCEFFRPLVVLSMYASLTDPCVLQARMGTSTLFHRRVFYTFLCLPGERSMSCSRKQLNTRGNEEGYPMTFLTTAMKTI